MVNEFDAKKLKNEMVQSIRDYFEENGKDCNAIIGISGGADSSIVAALCVEALGTDRVIGVLMPSHQQNDIQDAFDVCEYLDIKHGVYDIGDEDDINYRKTEAFIKGIIGSNAEVSKQTVINAPPRIRLKTLRSISQSLNGRVMNTCNLSEDWLGWSTLDGDDRGDYGVLRNNTKTEVIQVGLLILPEKYVVKPPSDGLCGKSDEDSFGFTYAVLDRYIRTGEIDDFSIRARIDEMHQKNKFKLKPMPCFEYETAT